MVIHIASERVRKQRLLCLLIEADNMQRRCEQQLERERDQLLVERSERCNLRFYTLAKCRLARVASVADRFLVGRKRCCHFYQLHLQSFDITVIVCLPSGCNVSVL
jgi:hypothetical protein